MKTEAITQSSSNQFAYLSDADQQAIELNALEAQQLKACEITIKNGFRSFISVGSSLALIRDKRLFRVTHKSFEEYCRDRWQLGNAYAHRLIGAYNVDKYLSPIGEIRASSESQLRPLTSLPPKEALEAWQNAVAAAGSKSPTAKQVKAAAAQFQPPTKPSKAKKQTAGSAYARTVEFFELIDQIRKAIAKKQTDQALLQLDELQQVFEKYKATNTKRKS